MKSNLKAMGIAAAVASATMNYLPSIFPISDRGPRVRRGRAVADRNFGTVKRRTGHRAPGYKRTEEDIIRLQIAEDRRMRRGAKLQRDYDKCIANNPCLRGAA